VEKFKQSLVRLGGLLKKEKVEEKLGISLKDPEKYTVQDILEITAALQARKNNDRKMGGCMNRLQNVFRAVARRGDLAKKVVSFVPNDVYGSIACGGITMILAVRPPATLDPGVSNNTDTDVLLGHGEGRGDPERAGRYPRIGA